MIEVDGSAKLKAAASGDHEDKTVQEGSSRTISVSVSPNNASYRVEWDSNNTAIVIADSNSTSVTIRFNVGYDAATRTVLINSK